MYAFGGATFWGSVPGAGAGAGVSVSVTNIVGMAVTPGGHGYWLIGNHGGIYAFGAADFGGSLPGLNVHVTNIVGGAAL